MGLPDSVVKAQQLRRESLEIRLNALRAQIDAANALCSTAEIEARWEPPQIAERAIQKIQYAVDRLRRHIENSALVTVPLRDDLRERVAAIETRLQTIRNSVARPKGEESTA